MKEINCISYVRMNGHDILLISDNYYGVPLIGYVPGKIIVTKKTYDRCKKFIIGDTTECDIVFI